MSIRNLQHLFEPRSVAVVGASDRPRSVGAAVTRNVLAAGFLGKAFLVSPTHRELAGVAVYEHIAHLPEAPDLAVVCTPPATVPGLIAQLGALGTRAAVVITAGLSARDTDGIDLRAKMLEAARPHLLRVLGPNCVGLLVPALGLNASFAHVAARPGRIAFVSQSGALVTAILDRARSRGIGFSKFVSLGDAADVDLGDVLDYLGSDADTHSILMYVEAVTSPRKFMSAARAAARNKPVLVVKAGRGADAARAAASHTGAMAGTDAVYDAAIRRAGMLRVHTTDDLLDAVETLACMRPLDGERLAILTNGGGPGVMAVDALDEDGGSLATLSPSTMQALDRILPRHWSHGNPVDIIGDAPPERYAASMQTLVDEKQAEVLLVIHAPTAVVPSEEVAQALLPVIHGTSRNVLSCWLGGDSVRDARARCSAAGVPTYETPEDAVRALGHMVRYRRNQQMLMETPRAGVVGPSVDRARARLVLQRAHAEARTLLSGPEAREVLAAYAIPVVATRPVRDALAAVSAATEFGYPVVLKVLSPDITHKSDVNGVALDLADAASVAAAAQDIERDVRARRPDADLQGYTVEPMVRRPHAHECIVGCATDPVFGPVILFGRGGIATEIVGDRVIGLPPLNAVLARDLVQRTRIGRLLAGYRGRPAADVEAVVSTLIQISQLVSDMPQIAELDINPLLVDEHGVVALDARIRIDCEAPVDRLVIRPYPQDLEQSVDWERRSVLLRPVRPEDAVRHVEFFEALDLEDVHYRTLVQMRSLEQTQLARLTQIDYDREMAIVAIEEPERQGRMLGVARAVTDPDNVKAELTVILRADVKGLGLGRLLLGKLLNYCRSRGTQEIVGETQADNRRMIALARAFRFEILPTAEPAVVKLRLRLASQPVAA